MKLSNYYLSIIWIAIGLSACQSEPELYKKTIKKADYKSLALSLTDGIHDYYQGTVPQQHLLIEALKFDSTNGDTWREKGVPYLKRGMAVEFEEHYKNAVQYNPTVWTGWRGYIYLFFYRDYERAISDFDMTDSITPDLVDYPQALSVDYLRALCYLQINKLDTSIALFEKHLVYERKISGEPYIMPQAYLYKGIAQFKKTDFVGALNSFESGLKLNPTNADLLFWKAKAISNTKGKALSLLILAEAEKQLKLGNRNTRPYVEEFYVTYQSDIIKAREKLNNHQKLFKPF